MSGSRLHSTILILVCFPQANCLSSFSSNTLNPFQLSNLCTCCFICLECSSPGLRLAYSVTSFRFLLKCQQLRKDFSHHLLKNGILCYFLLFYPDLLILRAPITTWHHVIHLLICLFRVYLLC